MKSKKFVVLTIAALMAMPTWAGSTFRSTPSFSRPTPNYSKPAPIYKAPTPQIIKQNTTVVQQRQTVVHQTNNSGGGFLSSMVGSFAGAGIATWLFSPKPEQAPPAQQVDCTLPQNKTLQICQLAK